VEISEKCDRLVVDVYGCGNDSPALIELRSSSHGTASREEIDKVKDTYGLIDEPKWYLSRQRALWRAVRWSVKLFLMLLLPESATGPEGNRDSDNILSLPLFPDMKTSWPMGKALKLDHIQDLNSWPLDDLFRDRCTEEYERCGGAYQWDYKDALAGGSVDLSRMDLGQEIGEGALFEIAHRLFFQVETKS